MPIEAKFLKDKLTWIQHANQEQKRYPSIKEDGINVKEMGTKSKAKYVQKFSPIRTNNNCAIQNIIEVDPA